MDQKRLKFLIQLKKKNTKNIYFTIKCKKFKKKLCLYNNISYTDLFIRKKIKKTKAKINNFYFYF